MTTNKSCACFRCYCTGRVDLAFLRRLQWQHVLRSPIVFKQGCTAQEQVLSRQISCTKFEFVISLSFNYTASKPSPIEGIGCILSFCRKNSKNNITDWFAVMEMLCDQTSVPFIMYGYCTCKTYFVPLLLINSWWENFSSASSSTGSGETQNKNNYNIVHLVAWSYM